MPDTQVNKWKSSREHDITLPSGTQVTIVIPNLPQLIKTGQIPNDLVNIALGAGSAADPTPDEQREMIIQQADVYNKLVSISVKKPTISEEDVPELPYEDVEMIVEIATRQRDVDAIGHHIGGLEKIPDFRKFRTLGLGASALEGA